jgi:hypothetical protein
MTIERWYDQGLTNESVMPSNIVNTGFVKSYSHEEFGRKNS